MNRQIKHKVFPPPYAAFLVSAAAFILLASGLHAPGLTWDESHYIPAAIGYLSWFEEIAERFSQGALLQAFSRESIEAHLSANWEHPPLAKAIFAMFIRLLHPFAGIISSARAGSAFLFALIVFIIYKTADRLYGGCAGLFSSLFFLLMPRVFGHGRLAALDICLSFTCALAAFLFLKSFDSKKYALAAGFAAGMGLATKLNAVLIPLPVIMWVLFYKKKGGLANALIMIGVSLPAAYALWPWIWHSPIEQIGRYLHFHLLRDHLVPVYYLGRIYDASPAPFHYPLVLTAATLPPAALLLCVSGFLSALTERFKNPGTGFILLNAAAPILFFTIPGIPKYDGIRLFMPAFPFIAVIAGAELNRILPVLKRRFCPKKIAGILFLFFAMVSIPVFRINPYHLSYYSSFAGGIRGARHLGFETTYWGDTLAGEVVGFLNSEMPENSSVVFYPVGENVVMILQATGYLRNDITAAGLDKLSESDFLVLLSRQGKFTDALRAICEERQPVFTLEFQGVPLTRIYRLE